jgi:hypothetical protein
VSPPVSLPTTVHPKFEAGLSSQPWTSLAIAAVDHV